MILDERNEFADAAAIALNIGNAIAPNTDVIDLGATPTLRDLGSGQPIYLVLEVDTAFVGNNATVQFQLVSDSTANLATSKTIHIDTGALGLGAGSTTNWSVAGFTRVYALPMEVTYERYLGLWMTVGTANVTAGKLNAYLATDVASWTPYADATN